VPSLPIRHSRVYNQHYSFVIEFSGGRICAVREYLDTQQAHAVWYAKDQTGRG